MSARLDKIGAELEKARKKRDEWDAKAKELERKYKEVENTEIHDLVHAAKLTPDQLAAVLRSLEHAAPDMTNIPNEEGYNDEN